MTGLKEIAVLAGVGLPATLIFVLTALPRAPFLLPEKDGFAMTALLKVLARLPRLTDAPRLVTIPLLAAVLVFLGTGLANVRTAGGVADLQNAPQVLIEDQRVVQEYLALPSPAQFYTVTGKTLDEALLAEKTLLSKLRGVSGIEATALSDVVPDRATQAERAACFYEALDAAAPLLTELLGAAPEPRTFSPVTPEDWIEAGLGARVTPFLLTSETGKVVTVVRLSGVAPEHLPTLQSLCGPGVHFVNLTALMTDEMNRYRTLIFEGLAAGLAILTLALSLRMGRHTWRAILPPVLGIAAALAVLGHAGQPVTLFTALALVLLLGLGVDYGIFLYHQPISRGRLRPCCFRASRRSPRSAFWPSRRHPPYFLSAPRSERAFSSFSRRRPSFGADPTPYNRERPARCPLKEELHVDRSHRHPHLDGPFARNARHGLHHHFGRLGRESLFVGRTDGKDQARGPL